MDLRVKKQLIFGGIYSLIFIIILGFLFRIFISPLFRYEPTCFDNIQNQGEEGIDCGGPCTKPCITSLFQPITLEEGVRIFYVGQSKASILAKIKNPNPDIAASYFEYIFSVYDPEGNLLLEIKDDSFLYAGEIKYFLFPNLNISPIVIDKVEFTIKKVEWVKASDFPEPKIAIQNYRTEIKEDRIEVRGIVKNREIFSIPEVKIMALFYGKYGQIAGASFVVLRNILPEEERRFIIFHPSLPNVVRGATKVFVYPNPKQ